MAASLLMTGALTGPTATAAAARCPSSVTGDVNGDGHAEVAVGEPRAVGRSGAVHLFYGSKSGLVTKAKGTALDDQYLTPDSPGMPGSSEPDDNFGGNSAFGDFDKDGCADLVIGASGVNDGDGSITVLRGTRKGISTTGARAYTTDSLFGARSPNERFGSALVVGDFNHDGTDDLAVGAPARNVRGAEGEIESAGGVAVLFGSPDGLNQGSVKPRLLTRESLLRDISVPPGPGAAEHFGRALAAGDFDRDGAVELAVGAPGNGLTYLGGSVQSLAFAADGSVKDHQPVPFSQGADGVPGDDVAWDTFGLALAAGDVDGDGYADLAIGAPGENCPPDYCDELWGEGAVTLLRGSAAGLTGTDSQEWSQSSPGVGGTAREDDAFGISLAMGHLDADGRADLAIGAVTDFVGPVRYAGTVTLLLGRPSGLSTDGIGGKVLHQDTPGIGGHVEERDGFGSDVAVARVQGSSQDNLIISARSETIGGLKYAGQVHALRVGRTGPQPKGSQTLHAGSPGVKGKQSANAGFGSGLG